MIYEKNNIKSVPLVLCVFGNKPFCGCSLELLPVSNPWLRSTKFSWPSTFLMEKLFLKVMWFIPDIIYTEIVHTPIYRITRGKLGRCIHLGKNIRSTVLVDIVHVQ